MRTADFPTSSSKLQLFGRDFRATCGKSLGALRSFAYYWPVQSKHSETNLVAVKSWDVDNPRGFSARKAPQLRGFFCWFGYSSLNHLTDYGRVPSAFSKKSLLVLQSK